MAEILMSDYTEIILIMSAAGGLFSYRWWLIFIHFCKGCSKLNLINKTIPIMYPILDLSSFVCTSTYIQRKFSIHNCVQCIFVPSPRHNILLSFTLYNFVELFWQFTCGVSCAFALLGFIFWKEAFIHGSFHDCLLWKCILSTVIGKTTSVFVRLCYAMKSGWQNRKKSVCPFCLQAWRVQGSVVHCCILSHIIATDNGSCSLSATAIHKWGIQTFYGQYCHTLQWCISISHIGIQIFERHGFLKINFFCNSKWVKWEFTFSFIYYLPVLPFIFILHLFKLSL